jgi:hypothetical protein
MEMTKEMTMAASQASLAARPDIMTVILLFFLSQDLILTR